VAGDARPRAGWLLSFSPASDDDARATLSLVAVNTVVRAGLVAVAVGREGVDVIQVLVGVRAHVTEEEEEDKEGGEE